MEFSCLSPWSSAKQDWVRLRLEPTSQLLVRGINTAQRVSFFLLHYPVNTIQDEYCLHGHQPQKFQNLRLGSYTFKFLQNTESIAKNGYNKSCLTDCICLAKAVDRITGTGRAQPSCFHVAYGMECGVGWAGCIAPSQQRKSSVC